MDKDSDQFRKLGRELKHRSKKVGELGKEAPRLARELEAYRDALHYIGDELERAKSNNVEIRFFPKSELERIVDTLNSAIPDPKEIGLTTSSSSFTISGSADIMMTYQAKHPEYELFQNPPESYRELKFSEDTLQKLQNLDPQLGNLWQNAWDAMTLFKLKEAGINARTLIDELS